MKFGTLFDDLLDLFYPQLCPSCQEPLVKGEDVICINCLWDLPFTRFHDQAENTVEQRLWGKVDVEAATALFYYNKLGKVQRLIYGLKYHGQQEVGRILGRYLGEELNKSKRFKDIDLVMPVPLHPKKKEQRGYNQCDLIVEGMIATGFKAAEENLIRLRHNTSQTKKSLFNRWDNVSSLFGLKNPDKLSGKHILLIDDVITSGSTLESCVKAFDVCDDVRLSIAAIACAE